MERIVTTCFGEFIIEDDIATSVMDEDFYYHLPESNMTDDEIKNHFRILKEMEE